MDKQREKYMGMDLKLKSLITLKPFYTKLVVEVEVEVVG